MNKKKGTELKLHQREHFERKIEKRLKPEIEREELRIKTTIQSILGKGQKNFAKKIGADKVISALEKAEDNLRTASRNAYIFFDKEAGKTLPYNKVKDYKFSRDDKNSISVKDCREQLDKWAEVQAQQLAEKTPQGQRLAYLRALQEKAEDLVKEASISDELTQSLDNLFQMVGVSWERNLPQLPRK
tara:strand:- start:369 stop:929 length:561 start_codon:yes stop_codon:yes gene_type:complete